MRRLASFAVRRIAYLCVALAAVAAFAIRAPDLPIWAYALVGGACGGLSNAVASYMDARDEWRRR